MPLIAQMNPDASTIAAGAPVEVDLGPIAEGQVIKVFWRGKPIFISHRTKKEIEEAADVDLASLPDPQPDDARQAGQAAVAGADRHLHPSRLHPARAPGRSTTATSARATARSTTPPAASAAAGAGELPLPPYEFLSDTKIRIG